MSVRDTLNALDARKLARGMRLAPNGPAFAGVRGIGYKR
ncbi:hypothetical protein J2X90_002834 [Variovorax paradoxus]|nr:hypothetical protein [Variovorax paradoxus]